MRYPSEVIEEIRLNNDIVEVVSSYIKLKSKGSNYFGCCPFHNEKTPSFSVSKDKQFYYCFGCGASGNVYSFIMRIENCNFEEAIKFLAQRANYALPEQPASEQFKKKAEHKARLLEINKVAAKYFYNNLKNKSNSKAIEYLAKRKVFKNTITKFGLGYSLDFNTSKNDLYNYLLKCGYDEKNMLELGLIVKSKKNGEYFDRFTGRLMFPIFDALGNVIGFGGRTLNSTEPKYLNSPDTPLFDKSNNLYGINFARKSKNNKEAILVEGYLDVLSLFQNGFENAVASLGTGFTVKHAQLLKKHHFSTVIIAFDNDTAGLNATLRIIPILVGSGLSVKVLNQTIAKDPDELISKFGAEKFAYELNNAENYISFQINCLKNKYNIESEKAEQKVQFTKEAAMLLANLENAIEQDAYIKETADLTGISYSAIKSEIDKPKEQQLIPFYNKEKQIALSKKENGSEIEPIKRILFILANSSFEVCKSIKQHLLPEHLGENSIYSQILEIIYNLYNNSQNIQIAQILNYFETAKEQQQVVEIISGGEINSLHLEKEISELCKKIILNFINTKIKAEKDANKLNNLIKTIPNIQKLYIKITDG